MDLFPNTIPSDEIVPEPNIEKTGIESGEMFSLPWIVNHQESANQTFHLTARIYKYQGTNRIFTF